MDRPRIVFFGTPEFAARTLEYLLEQNYPVIAVVSKPDKPIGRSLAPQPTPVKKVAEKYGLPLFQPEKVSADGPADVLQSLGADIFVVVAYGEIIKQRLLDMPPLGCINVHASLLPKYRGAAPIQRSIMDGEKVTGVTIMHMVKQMDAGDIIDTVEVPIGEETTYGELADLLCVAACPLLAKTIMKIAEGTAARTPQNHAEATMAPKIELEDCEVQWSRPAQAIHDLVRGSNPEPGAWCSVFVKGENKRLKVYKTQAVSTLGGTPGEILEWGPKKVVIACGEGAIELLQVQLEGKKSMSAAEMARGIQKEHIKF